MPVGGEAVRIARATEADVPLILALIKALADYERMSEDVVATEERLKTSLFGPNAHTEVVIAYVGDEPAGFALWFYNYSTFLGRAGLYLEDLFVKPEWRRRGVGRALLQHLAQVAVDRNCGRMEWSVLDWNEPAIQFYRRIGARAMDEWTVFRLTGDALQRAARGDSA